MVENNATKLGRPSSKARSASGAGREQELSIRRGLDTLVALSSEEAISNGGLGVVAIAQALGRDKSQMSRTLATLAEYGFVDRDPSTLLYRLGWRIFTMASIAGDRRLVDCAEPLLAELTDAFGELACLSTMHGTASHTIAFKRAARAIQNSEWVGRVTPLYCASVGKALLMDHATGQLKRLFEGIEFEHYAPNTARDVDAFAAMLDQARAQGYATAQDEYEVGLVGASAPIRDVRGEIIAALNVSGPGFRLAGRLSAVGESLIDAAQRLEVALRGGMPASGLAAVTDSDNQATSST